MHRIAALLLAVAVSLTAAAGATAFEKYRVKGPKRVHVGQEVRFPTTGLKPHEKITVNVVPTINRGGNCCGIDVIRNARADKNGEAILHFKWPRYYLNGDDRKRWRKGSKVDVIVLGDSGRGLKVVRMRRR